MTELVLNEGFKSIKKKDINEDFRWVTIPVSVTKIEKDAFLRVNQHPDTFTYNGTMEELLEIDGIFECGALCVNCTNGMQILHL